MENVALIHIFQEMVLRVVRTEKIAMVSVVQVKNLNVVQHVATQMTATQLIVEKFVVKV